MLALADKNGEVAATVPGLADMARVSSEECEIALKTFLTPDPDSRSKDSDGRRIEEIEGGWEIINHAKYRKMTDLDDMREKNAARQRRFKARNVTETQGNAGNVTEAKKVTLPVTIVTLGNAPVTKSNDIATPAPAPEAEATTKTTTTSSPETAPAVTVKVKTKKQLHTKEALEELYQIYPRHDGHLAALTAIDRAITLKGFDPLKEAVQAYALAVASWPAGDRQFIPQPTTWFNQGRYDDDRDTWRRNGTARSVPPTGIGGVGTDAQYEEQGRLEDLARAAKGE